MEINKRAVGSDKESLVSDFLQKNNVEILERNFTTEQGEIDIIGKDGDYLVFFEVKYRISKKYGNPLEAVTYSKRKRIVKAARVYLYAKRYPEKTFIRFDCVGILDGRIEWVKNAFDAF